MPQDYYSDNPGDSEKANPGPDTPKPAERKDADEGETALLPKSILAGKEFKVGEEVVLKIVRMYEDEVEVEYAKGEGGESENEDMAKAHSDMDEMADNPGKGGY